MKYRRAYKREAIDMHWSVLTLCALASGHFANPGEGACLLIPFILLSAISIREVNRRPALGFRGPDHPVMRCHKHCATANRQALGRLPIAPLVKTFLKERADHVSYARKRTRRRQAGT